VRRFRKTIRLAVAWAFLLLLSLWLAAPVVPILIAALITTAISVGVSYLTSLFTPKPPAVHRGKRDPLQMDSQYGNPIPRIYGKVRLAGEVIWTPGIREQQTTIAGGGKGKRRQPDQVQYSYYASWAVRFCKGRADGQPVVIKKIWFDTKLVFDGSELPPPPPESVQVGWIEVPGELIFTQATLNASQLKFYYGAPEQLPDPVIEADKGAGMVSAHRGHVYARFVDVKLDDFGARIPNVTAELDEGTTSVGAMVKGELMLAGLAEGEIDVSQIEADTCEGFLIQGRSTARENIEQLAQSFFFDLVEVDGKMRAVKRGQLPVAVVPYSDIGAYDDGDQPPPRFQSVRAQNLEIPRGVDVTFFDPAQQYETGKAGYVRQIYASKEIATINLALVMNSALANKIARIQSVVNWTEREPITFSLPPKYLRYVPTDVLTLTRADGSTVDVRLQRMEFTPAGKLNCTAVRQLASAYRQIGVSASGADGIGQQQVEAPVNLDVFLKGGFTLNDVDALTSGFYVAASVAESSPANSKWRGALFYRNEAATDEVNANYQYLAGLSVPATTGRALTVLSPGSGVDTEHTVDIYLTHGALESITQSTFDGSATANVAILGDEVIQFREATQPDPNQPKLWRLGGAIRRAMRATNDGANTHQEGDVFVLADSALRRIAINADQVGVAYHYKAVAFGADIEESDFLAFTA
jgi:hypothetical protein